MKTRPDPNTPPALLRRSHVLALTSLSDSALHRLVSSGQFPMPTTLVPGGRIRVWPNAVVMQWIEARGRTAA